MRSPNGTPPTARYITAGSLVLLCALCGRAAAGGPFIVEDGRARAAIVIAGNPPRSTRLAAAELQRHIEKISGARLPIATDPGGDLPVRIYVGRSPATERLGISDENLHYGAYRIVSGKDRLVLIGRDDDFTPVEPWPRSHGHWISGKVHAQWDAITGAVWGNPMARLHKNYTGRAWDFDTPASERGVKSGALHVWAYDERGSFNAVCGFLRDLGVRWYLPGERGTVVPSRRSIRLPAVDRTVRPDFPVRRFNFRFGVQDRAVGLWAMHLGVRDPFGLQVAHGLATMTHRKEMLAAHPEYYALYGGKRHNRPGRRLNQLCLSSPGLFDETVRYVRTVYDHYGLETVSVMPPDGFTAMCQCPRCAGKDTPDRGARGRLSDYVWNFVDRVARETGKTHPDRKVLCCAYGAYKLPPLKIEKLQPNVRVCIVGGRRPRESKPAQREEVRALRRAWLEKTGNRILIFENYPFTGRGWYLPSYLPRVIGRSVNAVKGISRGEDIWLTVGRDFDAPGFNHVNVYFTTRMYWGGPHRDPGALFAEYCRLFYGPAAEEMKAFLTFCEEHWQEMRTEKEPVDKALALFDAARKKVQPESVYHKRLALVDEYLAALRSRSRQLAVERGPVPELRFARAATGIRIDGIPDEPFWEDAPYHARGRLRELQTGRRPTFGTTFKAAWGRDGCIYFAVRCRERAGDPVNIGTKKDDDPAIWYGDVVEILLETDAHSYYQVAINPAGAVADLDRGASRDRWYRWDAQATVATRVGEDYWTAEVRIPVAPDANDPLHQVVGRKPVSDLPWYFNVCRQRTRETGVEHAAFSPTGKKTFHEKLKFARLYVK